MGETEIFQVRFAVSSLKNRNTDALLFGGESHNPIGVNVRLFITGQRELIGVKNFDLAFAAVELGSDLGGMAHIPIDIEIEQNADDAYDGEINQHLIK